MESDHVKGTIDQERNCPEAEYEDSELLAEAKICRLSSTSSVSSSFSRSSLEIDTSENNPFDCSPTESKCDRNPFNWQDSVTSPDRTVQTPRRSTLNAPSIQTMGHPPGYDPNRIPSSVFSTKAANASDWSIASNESLFSIHMGNGSFSRELWRSGELPRLDEWNGSQSLCGSEAKYNELSSLPSSLPPVVEVSAHEEGSVKSSNASRVDNEGFNNSPKVVPLPTKTMLTSSSTPRKSDDSGRSSTSFAFPVLVSDGGKTGSLEGVEEKPEEAQLQTQDSKAMQRSSIGRWFSWFSCLPRCC